MGQKLKIQGVGAKETNKQGTKTNREGVGSDNEDQVRHCHPVTGSGDKKEVSMLQIPGKLPNPMTNLHPSLREMESWSKRSKDLPKGSSGTIRDSTRIVDG